MTTENEPGQLLHNLQLPEYSEWRCYMFGEPGTYSFTFQPVKGHEPNWFWRKMQFLVFGFKWVKEG